MKQNSDSFESLFCLKNDYSLVATGCNVAPVFYSVTHILCSCRTVTEGQLTVGDFAATAIFLDVIPVAKCVLVFDLRSFLAREGDRPVCGICSGQCRCTGIPLWVAAIQTIEEARNMYTAPCFICRRRDGHLEDQCDGAE